MSDRETISELRADPAAELAELRAKRAALAAAKEKRDEARSAAELLVAEKQALRDDEAIEQFEAEIGAVDKKIAVIHTDLGAVILKRAHPAMFKRFQDRGDFKTEAVDKLVRPCLLYPTPAEFDRILDELPATLVRLGNAVSALAGQRSEDVTGKP